MKAVVGRASLVVGQIPSPFGREHAKQLMTND
jgi:hypothetical protein